MFLYEIKSTFYERKGFSCRRGLLKNMQNTNKYNTFHIYKISLLAGLIGLAVRRDFFIYPYIIIGLLMFYLISGTALFYNKRITTIDTFIILKITFIQIIPVFTGDILLRLFLPDLTGIWTMAFCTVFMVVLGKESEKYFSKQI